MSRKKAKQQMIPSEEVSAQTTSQTLWESGDDSQKMLTWAYLGIGLIMWFVLGAFFEFLFSLLFTYVLTDSALALTYERFPFRPGFVLGALIAIGTGFYARYVRKEYNQFGIEVVSELKKVTWPSRDVTAKSTVAVIITVFICAIILGLFDLLWGNFSRVFLQ